MVRASHALGLVHASTVGLPKAVEINPHARNLSFSLQKRKVSALTFLFQERFPSLPLSTLPQRILPGEEPVLFQLRKCQLKAGMVNEPGASLPKRA